MLLAQFLIVGYAFSDPPLSRFEAWLWNLDAEGNLVNIFSTTQLALVGCLALFAGQVAIARPVWQRRYFSGIGILFIFFAWDEFYELRAHLAGWHLVYAVAGLIVAALALLAALRRPRKSRIWHICFLVGLAIGATGAIFIDIAPWDCKSRNIWQVEVDGCVNHYEIEETLELLGVWFALVAMAGLFSDLRAAGGKGRGIPRALRLLPPLLLLIFLLPVFWEMIASRLTAQPIELRFASDIGIEAYRLEIERDMLAVSLFMSSKDWRRFAGLGISIRIMDQVSGQTAAFSDDRVARGKAGLSAFFDPLLKQRNEVIIPSHTPANRAYWIVLNLWRGARNGFVRQRVLSSDHWLLDETQIVLGEFALREESAPAGTSQLAIFNNGFALEAAILPALARASESLELSFTWRSNASGEEDMIQFLHLGHDDSGEWFIYDQPPLGPRLPTRLWYEGLSDSETWRIPLPDDLAGGVYSLYTGLYRALDKERAPVRSADGSVFVDFRVPLGKLTIEGAA